MNAYAYSTRKRGLQFVEGIHANHHADPSERPRKRSSIDSDKSALQGNTAVQAWELYQRLKINAKAGIKKPDVGLRSIYAQPLIWTAPEDRVDNCPAPCHAITTTGNCAFTEWIWLTVAYKPNISHLEMIRVVLAGSLERQLHLEDVSRQIERG